MLAYLLLTMVGVWISAPVWYFAVCLVGIIAKIFTFGVDMYKKGLEHNDAP